MVIYVDILFVVNFFITYLLLLLTSLLMKKKRNTVRLLLSSAIGGIYSLVILADNLGFLLTAFGKIGVSFVIIFTAFGFYRPITYFKSVFLFYLSNMLFLGIIIAVQLIFKGQLVTVKNYEVYFNISAKTLLLSAFAAYLISVCAVKIYNRTIDKKQVYSLTIFKSGNEIHLFALSDSGNKLKEPFSDFPVIVADKSKISFDAERVVPYNTVGGEGVLQAFRPDKVRISNGKNSFETDRVYIAVSEIGSNDFSAIINPEILSV